MTGRNHNASSRKRNISRGKHANWGEKLKPNPPSFQFFQALEGESNKTECQISLGVGSGD